MVQVLFQDDLFAALPEFLAMHGPDESLGTCADSGDCLVARLIQWLYPGACNIVVNNFEIRFAIPHAWGLYWRFHQRTSLDLARVIDTFDSFTQFLLEPNSVTAGEFLAKWSNITYTEEGGV